MIRVHAAGVNFPDTLIIQVLIGDADGSENHLERGDIVAANPKIFRQLLVILARREGGRSAVVDAR